MASDAVFLASGFSQKLPTFHRSSVCQCIPDNFSLFLCQNQRLCQDVTKCSAVSDTWVAGWRHWCGHNFCLWKLKGHSGCYSLNRLYRTITQTLVFVVVWNVFNTLYKCWQRRPFGSHQEPWTLCGMNKGSQNAAPFFENQAMHLLSGNL